MAKLNRDGFVLTGIAKLRTGRQKGLRVSQTFEQAFRDYFGQNANITTTLAKMGRDGKIVIFKSGVNGKTHLTIYTPDNMPKPKATPTGMLMLMGVNPPRRAKVTAS